MQQGSILPFLKKSKAPRPEHSRSEGSRSDQPYHSRPYNSSSRGGSQSTQHQGPNRRRNMALKLIADETKAELPDILTQLPSFDAMDSAVLDLKDLIPLNPQTCPGHVLPSSDEEASKKGTRIKVFDMDTFDAAINIDPKYTAQIHMSSSCPHTAISPSEEDDQDQAMQDVSQDNTSLTSPRQVKPVAVLNLASERSAGGGWQNGALAQEEALCYRSSLYLSLHKSYYRLPSLSAIYSPSVLIIRDAMSRGHNLLVPHQKPADLPVTAVISVAALRHPALTDDKKHFKNEGQRAETKRKIRLTLRVAARNGHTKLVLGALGCGVFGNPPKEVAECFLEVLREKEFQGGWWEEVVFAILDNVKGEQGGKDGIGNYGEFWRVLDGQVV
ncbi:hypothetical protein FB567DRAFT_574933 [Paraphoma chrysanthemicola]|uniref:Microbial-type PARG catalytic domain-containing protein n=1 Tax=Paraphoma chrysanthemicola TaxID=798071 RepID=A0A8K0RJS3_9PLEO|nr:hypothetical protein FB567DRAFT_574933 [Paraphoma chrysanthemicola]